MIFATYLDKDNNEAVGVVSADRKLIYPVCQPYTMLDLIADYSPRLRESFLEKMGANQDGLTLENVQLLAPIPHPRHDILCVGQNYLEHALESAKFMGIEYKKPQYPVYFSKRVDRAVGHNGEIPPHSAITSKLDYEAELAVIIGKRCRNIKEDEVHNYIFGYTVANDVSARDLQTAHGQYMFGKGLDGFAPMGPWIVTADEIGFPPVLKIKSRVNGELRQNGHTGAFIFSIPHMISQLSQGMTLEPGDIFLTGTPSGVGMGFSPPKFLKSGDVVECEIEGIGLLLNIVG